MDKISLASGCDALNTTAQEAQCNVQTLPATMKQCAYMSLKSPNCLNYYDGQFSASIELKEEFPEDECPQSSTAASCINRSGIYSNIVFENQELSKVLERHEIKQEKSEEALSFIKTEENHDEKDKFVAKTEMSDEYRIPSNAGDTSLLYKVRTIPQEIQFTMCGGKLKDGNMDKRISQARGCDALNTIAQETQCNVQTLPPKIKQCGYKSLKSPNCLNYYDGLFCASTEIKEEFPCPQSSTAASCTNKSGIDSNIYFENEELSKVPETQEIKQEVSEEALSFIKTEEIHDEKDKFIAKTEMTDEYRIPSNAGDTSVLYKVWTSPQEIQPTTCGGILKNGTAKPPKTKAEYQKAYREREKAKKNVNKQESTSKPPKTKAEYQKEYRERQKAKRNENKQESTRKPPKTNAEHQKAFRERQKMKKIKNKRESNAALNAPSKIKKTQSEHCKEYQQKSRLKRQRVQLDALLFEKSEIPQSFASV